MYVQKDTRTISMAIMLNMEAFCIPYLQIATERFLSLDILNQANLFIVD